MNGIDVALVGLLLLCAVRGFWRGFFRESFGFLGLVLGLVAALRFADAGATFLTDFVPGSAVLPAAGRMGVAFVAIFVVVQTFLNLFGFLLDRLVGSLLVRRLNHAAGALFALAKGGAVLALVLLFFHNFPVVPGLDRRIVESRLGRPMVAAANSVIRIGLREGASPSEEGQA
jgi:uncharacterized membrane protein required for colicin V production